MKLKTTALLVLALAGCRHTLPPAGAIARVAGASTQDECLESTLTRVRSLGGGELVVDRVTSFALVTGRNVVLAVQCRDDGAALVSVYDIPRRRGTSEHARRQLEAFAELLAFR